MSLSGELDWVAKRELMEGYRRRDGLDWDAARLHLVDLQYSDVRPDKGLYNRLAARGRIKRLLDESEVDTARTKPPEDTRAYFRGRCLEQYADDVAAASWDSVIFDLPGRDSLQRVPTLERFAERVITSRSSWTAAVRPRTWSGSCPAAEWVPGASRPDGVKSRRPGIIEVGLVRWRNCGADVGPGL